jgi:hypothetical protein
MSSTSEKKRRDWLKATAAANDDWLLFDQDECWFSRSAQPNAFAWAEPGKEVRLVQRTPPPQEPQKALACFGAVRQDTQETVLYFADGQPKQ